MQKSNDIGLIRYEFIAYIHILGTQNVNEILLTKDDFADMNSQSDQIKWTPVENMDIDNIDNGDIDINSIVKTKKRICGLFDAEPLDWEYARIIVSDSTKTKHSYAIARMPKSPTVPVFFDVKE
ncbi:MAG: hypothetical protein MAG551_00504 [Candidatus Scalindua arabica]|uniref:Uncharacterized protein n=1 Tax=Candidatus Scalindua arabica TaxID=1127984 RepID=A0A941ZZ83_9BACT|nr:hypothetical protein [Candidatus Scalindua arabica]